MLPPILERVTTNATMIFDVEDRYARDRKVRGEHPRAIEPLRFWLVGTVEAGVPKNFPQPYEMVMTRNAEGYHLFYGQVISFGSTHPIRRSFLAGNYVVRITSELGRVRRTEFGESGKIYSQLYQWIEREDVEVKVLPSGAVGMAIPYPLPLEPGYAYPFPPTTPVRADELGACTTSPAVGQHGPTLLRGSLHALDGAGILGATVSAPGGQAPCLTDSSGQWVLVFDDTQASGPLTVTVTVPGQAALNLPNICVLQGCETGLPETALRGWVLRKGVGVSGAQVQVSGLPEAVQTLGDGSWTVYLRPDQGASTVNVTATLPDGSSQVVQNVNIQPRSTVLVSTFQFP